MVDGEGRWQRLLAGLLDWLLPPACALCEAPGALLCPPCLAELPALGPACRRCALPLPADPGGLCGPCLRRSPPFEALVAPFAYGPPLDRLLQALKYGGRLELARPLGERLAVSWLAAGPPPELLLPVPLHPRRLRQRGFNQALELARAAARRAGLPLAPHLLRRIRDTLPQAALDARARRANVRGAFVLAAGLEGVRRVALVDDVVTTGHTVAELARLLRRAGVEEVRVWAAARALPPRVPAGPAPC